MFNLHRFRLPRYFSKIPTVSWPESIILVNSQQSKIILRSATGIHITSQNSELFSVHPLAEALLNCPSCGICLKNLVSVFVLFHIVFSANDALGVEHSFAF